MSLIIGAWNRLTGLENVPMIPDFFSSNDPRLTSSTRQPWVVGVSIPPIHKLPSELLADIFALCHAMMEDDPSLGCARVILSHVCPRWRGIILSMPLLWSTINVYGSQDLNRPRVQEHLRRSASCLLSVRIYADKADHVEDSIELVVAHAQRLKALHFFMINSHASPNLDLLRTSAFPALETLGVSIRNWQQQDADSIFHLLSTSPRIRSLMWDGPGGLPSSPCWMAFTEIDIWNTLSFQDVHTLLSQCHNVVDLQLLRVSSGGPLVNEVMVTLHQLTTLSLRATQPLDDLLDRLRLPSLKRLSLKYNHHNPSYDHSCGVLDSLLVRSECTLEELTFRDDYMPSKALDQLLRIPKLDIVFPKLTDRTLRTLTRRGDSICIMPRLESLSFMRSRSTDGVLGDMVTSRSESGGGQHAVGKLECLQTAVEVSRSRDRCALDVLKAQGMDINYENW
ncbi:hypothetical protein HGRIS_000789 [Hohenbuehelia grisea]|uniref:F-box domain-containing protein n=1 Tax=Hohenbuehelia grisea TaxID=104357 RepID=A0ABR3IPR0_9AGAR